MELLEWFDSRKDDRDAARLAERRKKLISRGIVAAVCLILFIAGVSYTSSARTVYFWDDATYWDMSRSIQSGKIILDLLKPLKFRTYTFWSYSGSHVVSFIMTFIPTFIVVMIITKGAIPMGLNLVYFLISTVFALIVNFNIEMIVATICLYTESTWGIRR